MNQPAQVQSQPAQQQTQTPFQMMATRLSVDPQTVENLMTQTLMKAKGGQQQVSHEELMVFMSIANEYRLNPLTKEIYAFNNRGAIQPIVSIDGWLRIINGHSQFDGMEFDDRLSNEGALLAITCRIHRKDRSKPTEVTEYLGECQGTSEPWKKWPARMLRHKATIQCARYAFGLSGIIDEDEADRYKTTNPERDVTPQQSQREALEYYSDSDFEKNFPAWQGLIESGKKTPEQIVSMVSSKAVLTDEQKQQIMEVAA
ncbi:recombinase RecT [Chromohalobacter sp. 296-RDG]|uniref:recombinase RecT n=1 Tax=Chromohalobacter sp. 296-RDG TaxID=2994062 RepID=UPI002469A8F6|nr:recombinase RecT [Chromohalobacter sp. 296-RDG]